MKKIMFNDKYGLTDAVLGGKKTMTRRIIAHISKCYGYSVCKNPSGIVTDICAFDEEGEQFAPQYRPREIVAIAQSYKDLGYAPDSLDRDPRDLGIRGFMRHAAGWNNKMFVSANACRHHIKIVNIKFERLQDISDEDCFKEGINEVCKGVQYSFDSNIGFCYQFPFNDPRSAFSVLIDRISGKGTWEMNPYVWVYEFEKLD